MHEQSAGILISTCESALTAVDGYYALVRQAVAAQVVPDGKWDNAKAARYQHEVHGLAWLATYASSLRALLGWAISLHETNQLD